MGQALSNVALLVHTFQITCSPQWYLVINFTTFVLYTDFRLVDQLLEPETE